MRNFQPTQIAVNLLLIVVLAIQPIAICMAGGSSGSGCTSGVISDSSGCGCCAAGGSEEGGCCCCNSVSEEIAQDSCCGAREESSATSHLDSGEETSTAFVVSEVLTQRSICLCGHDSPPLSNSSTRYPASDHRDSLSNPIHLSWVVCESHRLRTGFQSSTNALPTNRFSQVVLCIWRL